MASYLKFLKRKEEKAGIRIKYRPYQQRIVETFEQGQRFLLICWARRLGKDMMTFSLAAKQCIDSPNSTVFYMFPTQKQGKQMLLEAKTTDHKPIISEVVNPTLLIKPRNSTKLFHSDNTIRFKNGSIIYIVDAVNYENKVGGNIDLLVCSEAAKYKNKNIINYLIPSIIQAEGKLIMVSTPEFGSDFNKKMTESSGIYYKSTINAISDEAVDMNGNPIYSAEKLELAKQAMSEELFLQEYMCDLDIANELSIYGRSIQKAKFIKPYQLPVGQRVFVSFDLGISDATAMTFSIINKDNKLEVIHHYHNNGEPTEHFQEYLEDFQKTFGITQNNIILIMPHDSENRQDAITHLTSRAEAYRAAGYFVNVLPAIPVKQSIEVTRASIQHNEIIFWENKEIMNMVSLIKQYEYKSNKVTGENLWIPVHGTGLAPSNTCDSLEAVAVSLFFDKYIKADQAKYKDFKPRDYSGDWRL